MADITPSSGAAATGGSSAASSAQAQEAQPAVLIKQLNFTYGTAAGFKPILHDLNMVLPVGSRTLLIGESQPRPLTSLACALIQRV